MPKGQAMPGAQFLLGYGWQTVYIDLYIYALNGHTLNGPFTSLDPDTYFRILYTSGVSAR